MKFKTHYNAKDFKKNPEIPKGKSCTERAGYIPAKQRIENMILAGRRLKEARAEQYDFVNGELDEDFDDPTREKNFDLADSSHSANYIRRKIKIKQKEFDDNKKLHEEITKEKTDPSVRPVTE